MNNCETTGIVRLEDLPHNELFIKLEQDFHNLLESKIRTFGIEKFERKIGSGRKIGHWLSDGSLIRFDILLKILEHFNLEYNGKIGYIRGKDGLIIKNPKLPFDFTSRQGCRIVAGILGDGGIPTSRPNPYYTNSDKDLIRGFITDVEFVFGDIEIGRRCIENESSLTTVLGFSSLVEKIFLRIGLLKGKKIETNPPIPSFIFNLPHDRKYAFISQFIDDEGSVNKVARHISIIACTLSYYDHPNVLKDVQKLLLDLGIEPSLYRSNKKSSISGENTVKYVIQINGQFQLKNLANNLNLRINRKKEDLDILIKSFRVRVFRKKECLKIYINLMKKVQDSKGYFTSLDISKETGMVVGSCRNTLIRFKEKGIIACIKPPTSGNFHEYGRYVLR